MLVAGVAILGFLTIPLFSIRLGFGDTGNLPETQTARRGYDMLAEGFGPGIGGRTVITVAGPAASDQAALDAFTAQLAATEGVAASPPPVVDPAHARTRDRPAVSVDVAAGRGHDPARAALA